MIDCLSWLNGPTCVVHEEDTPDWAGQKPRKTKVDSQNYPMSLSRLTLVNIVLKSDE